MLIVALGLMPAWASEKPTILVVQSYHRDYAWDVSYKQGLEETLGDAYSLRYFEMDGKRIPVHDYETKAEQAWQIYLELKPVMVILGDDTALRYLGQKFVGLSTPVVYLGINNNPRYYGMVGHPNITGILERPLLKRSLIMINDFLPIRRILVLFDSGVTAHIEKEESFGGNPSLSYSGIQVDLRLIHDYAKWKETVLSSKSNGYDAIIVGLYQTLVDDKGQHVPSQELLRWTSSHTPVPPFAFWDFAVDKNGAIGGYVLRGFEQGLDAGLIARKLLSGLSAQNQIPKTASSGVLLFSRSQLLKWGISLPRKLADKATFIP
jgi:ABC-type uncharacterized transport system substrate-binding protein